MNPILQALQNGYGLNSIMNFAGKAVPGLAQKINIAKRAGYKEAAIINFLIRMFENNPTTNKARKEESGIETTHSIHRKQKEREAQITKTVASLAGGSLIATLRAPTIANQVLQGQVLPALPTLPQIPPGQPPLQIGSIPPMGTPPTAPTPPITPPPSPITPSPTSTPTPNAPISNAHLQSIVTPISTKTQIEMIPGVKTDISNLLAAGNNPEQIAAYLRFTKGKQVKLLEDQAKKPLESILAEYISNSPEANIPPAPIQQNQPVNPIAQQQTQAPIIRKPELLPKLSEEKPQKPRVFDKGTEIITPDGIGNIKSVSGDKAIVEVKGKPKRVELDKTIDLPENRKELDEIYGDLIAGIEEETGQEVSKAVYWAGYDPQTNELAYVTWDGATYVYDDLDEDTVKQLTDGLTLRKTTGQNYVGAWKKGTKSPMGAALSVLIQKLQKERGGKGKEYKSKFMKIYDAFEPAKLAKKEKYEQAKKAAKKQKPS